MRTGAAILREESGISFLSALFVVHPVFLTVALTHTLAFRRQPRTNPPLMDFPIHMEELSFVAFSLNTILLSYFTDIEFLTLAASLSCDVTAWISSTSVS